MNDTMASTTRGIIRDAVMESRFKERDYQTYNGLARICSEQMEKHFNGSWHCHIGTAGQSGGRFYAMPGTTFEAEIDSLCVALYRTSIN